MKRLRPRSSASVRFRRPKRPQRSWLISWWTLWRVPTLVTLVAAAWWFAVRPITHEYGWVQVDREFSLCGDANRTQACVIDGDTLYITARGEQPSRIRLTGFDAPEREGACNAESELARSARAALLEWLTAGPFEWNGADEPPYDQYGRELRAARRILPDGSNEYLADAMIEQGLAAPGGWDGEIDWCR